MAVKFKEDEVEVVCEECKTRLISFQKFDMTLTEALAYADQYQRPILCKHCEAPPPDKIPEVLH